MIQQASLGTFMFTGVGALFLGCLFVYLSVRLGAEAWFRSRLDFYKKLKGITGEETRRNKQPNKLL